MTLRTYGTMRTMFNDFYLNRVKPCLLESEKNRKRVLLEAVCIQFFVLFLLGIGFAIYFIDIKQFGVMFIEICSCVVISSVLILSAVFKRNMKWYTGPDFCPDTYLKMKLMIPFLSIFSSDINWVKHRWKKTKRIAQKYRDSMIFNYFPYIFIDDQIVLKFRNTLIEIFDVSTFVLKLPTLLKLPVFFFIFLFGALLFSICTLYGLRLFLYSNFSENAIMLFNLFLILIIFVAIFVVFKLFLYSPFKGAVIEISLNKKFTGHTFILDKSASSNKIFIDKRKYEEVKLESTSFANKYTVYSTDQIESRYLLTTAMMQRIEDVKFSFKAKTIRVSFRDNRLLLTIKTGKDMFAMGGLLRQSNGAMFVELYEEIISILKLIEYFKIEENIGL